MATGAAVATTKQSPTPSVSRPTNSARARRRLDDRRDRSGSGRGCRRGRPGGRALRRTVCSSSIWSARRPMIRLARDRARLRHHRTVDDSARGRLRATFRRSASSPMRSTGCCRTESSSRCRWRSTPTSTAPTMKPTGARRHRDPVRRGTDAAVAHRADRRLHGLWSRRSLSGGGNGGGRASASSEQPVLAGGPCTAAFRPSTASLR